MKETAYQTFGRMLNNGELREITSFHILPADEQDFVYCTTYALQSHFPWVTFDKVKAGLRKGQLQLNGVWIRLAKVEKVRR